MTLGCSMIFGNDVHFQYEVHRTLHMQEKNSDIRKNEFFTMNHDNSTK